MHRVLLFFLVTVLGLSALSGLARRWHEEARLMETAATSTSAVTGAELTQADASARDRVNGVLPASFTDFGANGEASLESTREASLAVPRKPAVNAGVLNGRAIHYTVETTENVSLLPPDLIQLVLPDVHRALQRIDGVRQPLPEQVVWVPAAAATTPGEARDAELMAALSSEECAFVERCLLEVLQRDAPRNLPRGDLYVEPLNPSETIAFLRSDPHFPTTTCTSRYQLTWVTRDLVQWRASVSIPLVTPPPEPPSTRQSR